MMSPRCPFLSFNASTVKLNDNELLTSGMDVCGYAKVMTGACSSDVLVKSTAACMDSIADLPRAHPPYNPKSIYEGPFIEF